jgi:hypothetical protein
VGKSGIPPAWGAGERQIEADHADSPLFATGALGDGFDQASGILSHECAGFARNSTKVEEEVQFLYGSLRISSGLFECFFAN